MTSTVEIHPDHLDIIRHILNKHLSGDVDVWVFGSRAKRTTRRSSDLDLALEGKRAIEAGVMVRIRCDFEDSDLPYEVDVLDMSAIGENFRKIIENDRVPLER